MATIDPVLAAFGHFIGMELVVISVGMLLWRPPSNAWRRYQDRPRYARRRHAARMSAGRT
jgi:hypothetical protein